MFEVDSPNPDIRWKQRFSNYKKALRQFTNGVILSKDRELSLLEKQGLIKAFEFTQELAWKLLRDYLEYQGYMDIKGSRDAIRMAFQVGLIHDGDLWMQTIKARNITSHTYDEHIVNKAIDEIINQYADIFNALSKNFDMLMENEK